MIAKLGGIVDQLGPRGCGDRRQRGGLSRLLLVAHLGPAATPGGAARLLIETHVREDHIHLYGFIDNAERDWFRLLTTVQGVGARLALALLSVMAPDQLTLAILAQDKAALAVPTGSGPGSPRASPSSSRTRWGASRSPRP